MEFEQWKGFEKGEWKRQIDVRNFIQKNYTPYEGNSSFLAGTTEKTKKLWDKVLELYKKERGKKSRCRRCRIHWIRDGGKSFASWHRCVGS